MAKKVSNSGKGAPTPTAEDLQELAESYALADMRTLLSEGPEEWAADWDLFCSIFATFTLTVKMAAVKNAERFLGSTEPEKIARHIWAHGIYMHKADVVVAQQLARQMEEDDEEPAPRKPAPKKPAPKKPAPKKKPNK